jgi:hypothetical protein
MEDGSMDCRLSHDNPATNSALVVIDFLQS